MEQHLARILDEPVDARFKSFPPSDRRVTIGTIGQQNWNALGGDLLFPVMMLKEGSLQHNLALMARYCEAHQVSLAPHGKTTMAPQLFARQLGAGAWAITAATISQVRLFRAFGVERIILANQVVEAAALRWLASELAEHPEFDLFCLVDSLRGVSLMTEALDGPARALPVLLELGIPGGRTGCRSMGEALEVAAAVSRSPALRLAGVEGFEGIIDAGDLDRTLEAVDRFTLLLRELASELAAGGAFRGAGEVLVTAGGSAFFDRAVEHLAPTWQLDVPVRVVLRSGCYLAHDHGIYERASPLAARSTGEERLQPALELWSVVLSRPEPDRAILGFGKRDCSYDLGLPTPRWVRRTMGGLEEVDVELELTALNDQHAFLRVPPAFPLEVGDLVACGISHPCTAFDKWPLIPVVDGDYRVTEAIRTYF